MVQKLTMRNITDAFIYTHKNRKQLEEFKRLLMKSGYFKDAEGAKLSTRKIKESNYIDVRVLKISDDEEEFKFAIAVLPTNDLTVERMKNLNKQAEEMFEPEGMYGLKDVDALRAVLALCNQETFGREYHPTIIDKAAFIWYSVATKQMFHNGNKRTALLAGLTLLAQNFITFKIKDSVELYDISVKIAEGKMSQKELKKYIEKNSLLDLEMIKEVNDIYHIFN